MQKCPCVGGGEGVQTCADSGLSWGPCKGCPTIKDLNVLDASRADAPRPDGSLSDGPGPDKPDGPLSDSPGPEAGKPDASVDGPEPDGPLSDAPLLDVLQPDSSLPDMTMPDAPTYPSVKPKWTAMWIPAVGNLNAVWGSGPTDVYVAGDKGTILHYNGRKPTASPWWTAMTSGITSDLHGVWGSSRDDVFVAGENGIMLHYKGKQWDSVWINSGNSMYTVWGSADYSVGAAGKSGSYVKSARDSLPMLWKPAHSGTSSTLRGLWGSSPTNIIAVGDGGAIRRYNGKAWTAMTSGPKDMRGVWGSSASDIFAVGVHGTILHYNGKAWQMMSSKTISTLHGVWGSGPTDVYAVGENGTILHYDGKAWGSMASGTGAHLFGVWGSGPEDIFAVGYNTILRFGQCHCTVSKRCYRGGERDRHGCKICDPTQSTTALSPYSGDCKFTGRCYHQGEQDSTGCQSCDAKVNKWAWTPRKDVCNLNGVCYHKGFWGFTKCLVCNPLLSQTGWSIAPGQCQISGQCYLSSAKDSTGCQVCDPSKAPKDWTVVPGKCAVSGKCYSSGDKDDSGCKACTGCKTCTPPRTGCQTCDPLKNPKTWTVNTGKCAIDGMCYHNGQKDLTGCKVCDTAKDPKAWSVAPPLSCALPARQVTFALGSSLSTMTAAFINTNGSGYKTIPGFGVGGLNLFTMLIGRVNQYAPFTYDQPQALTHLTRYPIYLPNGRGHVLWYQDTSLSRVGVMQVRTNGTVASLYSMSGLSATLLSNYLTASEDGKYVASTRLKQGVVLMRTDGALFPNSKSAVELDISPPPYLVDNWSVTIAGDYVYSISRAASAYSSQHTLWSAPLTGKSGLTAVALPKVGGVNPSYLNSEITASSDGKVIAVIAGTYGGNGDIIAINRTTATAVNVSKNPGLYSRRGTTWGGSDKSTGSRLALSPSGAHVAYVRYKSGEVEVARTDGSGTPDKVTGPANFATTNITPFGLKFVDNDNLIFYAYKTSEYGDIFRFHVPSAKVINITSHNSSQSPIKLSSIKEFRTLGMWLSPNRKYLYFIGNIELPLGPDTSDIKGIDLSTWATKDITKGLEVYSHGGGTTSCLGKSVFFFVDYKMGSQDSNLFSFDMNLATPATQLTRFYKAGGRQIHALTPSADCSLVAFISEEVIHHLHINEQDVYTVKLTSPPVVSQLTDSAGTSSGLKINYYMGISQDNSQVVFFSGPKAAEQQMQVAPAVANCCKPKKVYKGGSIPRSWLLFSVQ